jgi:hypothetical protein
MGSHQSDRHAKARLALLGAASGFVALLLMRARKGKDEPRAILAPAADLSVPTSALPMPSDNDQTGQGQFVVVALLGGGSVLLGFLVSAFLLPPGYFAALAAYGPVLLIASIVLISHIRVKGFDRGDPPKNG